MNTPAYKLIPDTRFVVDGFQFRPANVTAWFLSHAHSDHYTGLRDTWDVGPVYCSEITGRLVQHICGVKAEYIHTLAMDTEHVIDGVTVVLVSANHCPGAVQFLFRLPSGARYVHCGDMRYCDAMRDNLHLQRFVGADAVFLDTTYCHPKHCFPPQQLCVDTVADLCQAYLGEAPDRLLLIASYTIGKEKIFIEVHKRCGVPLYISDKKRSVLTCLDWPDDLPFDRLFTDDPQATRVHIVPWHFLGESWPFFRPNYVNMESYAGQHGASSAIGFVPTGWTFEMKRSEFPVREKGPWKIHLVPFSEHSSFPELQAYVTFLRPKRLIPTVGVSERSGGDNTVRKMLKHFRNLVDTTSAKRSFLEAFGKGGSASGALPCISPGDDTSEEAALDGDDDCEVAPLPEDEARAIDLTDRVSAAQRSTDDECCDAAAAAPLHASAVEAKTADAPREGPSGGEAPVAGTAQARSQPGDLPPDVDMLMNVLGGALDLAASRSLLARAKGDVQAAVNLHYDAARPVAKQKGPVTPKASTPAKGLKRGKATSSKQAPPQQGTISSFFAKSPALRTPLAKSPSAKLAPTLLTASPPAALLRSPATPAQAATIEGIESNPPPTPTRNHQQQAPLCATAVARTAADVDAALQAGPARGAQSRPLDSGATENRAVGNDREVGTAPTAVDREPSSPVVKLPALKKPAKRRDTASAGLHGCDTSTTTGPSAAAALTAGTSCDASATLAGASSPGVDESDPRTSSFGLGAAPAAAAPAAPGREEMLAVAADHVSEAPVSSLALPVEKYKPASNACWSSGPAPYLHVAQAFAAMEATTKRLVKADVLTNMFRSVMLICPGALLATTYLAVGKLAPDYEDTQLNIGGSTVVAAIVAATGVAKRRLSEMYVKMGDLGDVAQNCRRNQQTLGRPAPLTVEGVYAKLLQIAGAKGQGSAVRKQHIIMGMLRSCRSVETKFLVRTLVQNLRIGANWRSVIGALGRAAALHEATSACGKATQEEAAEIALDAFHQCPNLQAIVATLQSAGLQALRTSCVMRPGVPVQPMLAKITNGVQDCVEQLGDAAYVAEFKYDGQRSQIHVAADGQVKMFSRHCEDKTAMFPDVAAAVLAAADFQARRVSFILDSELVAVDRAAANEFRAFQDLATRARGATLEAEVKVHVCVFVFDVVFIDGVSMLKHSLRERRRALKTLLPKLRPGYVELAHGMEVRLASKADAGPLPRVTAGRAPTVGQERTAAPSTGCSGSPASPSGVTAASAGSSERQVADHVRGVDSGPDATTTAPPATDGEHGGFAAAVAGSERQSDAPAPSSDTANASLAEVGARQGDTAVPAPPSNADARQAGQAPLGADWLEVRVCADAAQAVEELQQLLLEAFAASTEGLMIKRLDERSTYTPSKRSDSWLKVKKDYCEELRDSLDLVPIGAWYGNGRKAGWFSPFLLAAWDPEREEFQSMCRCMSGFTDEFYAATTARFRDNHLLEGRKPYYNTGERCDVWFEAVEVWEIRGADLTISPIHRAAVGRLHAERGCSLRFPRFIQVRADKRPEDASGPDYLTELFHLQTRKAASAIKQLAGRSVPGRDGGGTRQATDLDADMAARPDDAPLPGGEESDEE